MPQIEIIPTTAAHIAELRRTIREGDRLEIENTSGSCAKGLWRSFKQGLCNKTGLVDGCVAACWGVGGVYGGQVGEPWLLTSGEVLKVSPLTFSRIYRQEAEKMLQLFPRLENWVDSNYGSAVRLLKISGFTVDEPQKLGNGMFSRFWRE